MLLRFLTVKVKKHDLETNYFEKKDDYKNFKNEKKKKNIKKKNFKIFKIKFISKTWNKIF